jgi:hypothetical protein
VEGNKVILDLPSALGLSGTHSLAEITIRGMAPGAAKLSFENLTTGSSVVLADASVVVSAP